jgi:hypothetical protein
MDEGKPVQNTESGGIPVVGRDLQAESHILAVSLWFKINGVFMWLLAFGTLYYIRVKFDLTPERVNALKIGVIISLGWGVFLYLVGHFLGRFSKGARTVTRILAILCMLLCFYGIVKPHGLLDRHYWLYAVFVAVFLLGFMGLGLLLRHYRTDTLFTEDYLALVRREPGVKPATFRSPFFWAPLITFVVMIGVGAVFNLAAK